MKNILIALTLLTTSSFASAQSLTMSASGPSQESVESLKTSITPFVMGMSGVNGISTTACEEKSGTPLDQLTDDQQKGAQFVYCLEILTETQIANDALSLLYPAGSKSGDIYVIHKVIGAVQAL